MNKLYKMPGTGTKHSSFVISCVKTIALVFSTIAIGIVPCSAQELVADITFDHANPGDTYFVIEKEPGAEIVVRIENTLPDAFTYSTEGFKEVAAAAEGGQSELADKKHAINKIYKFTYSPVYSGYLFDIEKRTEKPVVVAYGENGEETATLVNHRLIIVINSNDPDIVKFSGGLSFAFDNNPLFATTTKTSDSTVVLSEGEALVVRDNENESDGVIGATAFLTARTPNELLGSGFNLGATIGLGLGDNKGNILQSVFAGISLIYLDQFFITGGVVYMPFDRLPNSVNVGDVVENDPNLLSNLPTRNKWSPFIGVSYEIFAPSKDVFMGAFGQADDE